MARALATRLNQPDKIYMALNYPIKDLRMALRTIHFLVSVKYDTHDDSPLCEQLARENLEDAIENERVNCALTPDNVSALSCSVSLTEHCDGEIEK